MFETKGPEIKSGSLQDNEPVDFWTDQEIEILTDYTLDGNETRLTCSYKGLPTTVKPGDKVIVGENILTCEVLECLDNSIRVKCLNDAHIEERMSMNLPGCVIDLPSLTDKDWTDISNFGIEKGIDMVCVSFIRKPEDVEEVREVMGSKGAHVKIIAKIENQEGLNNFPSILEAADGVSISWSDLCMEIPPEKVFIA